MRSLPNDESEYDRWCGLDEPKVDRDEEIIERQEWLDELEEREEIEDEL